MGRGKGKQTVEVEEVQGGPESKRSGKEQKVEELVLRDRSGTQKQGRECF